MTKSKRLKPIIKIAEEREQEAVKVFVELQNVLQTKKAKLDETLQYKEEYQKKFTSTDSGSRSAFQFNDYLAFLRRLDIIIGEQRRIIAQVEQEVEIKRQEWLKTREKTQALGKAAERFQSEERALIEKKEQKDADERAQRSRPNLPENDEF